MNPEQISFTALLNSYCREFTNWKRYQGIPQHDSSLRSYMNQSKHTLHLRFDFSAQDAEVFAPLACYTDSGRHLFHFPIFKRQLSSDEITAINAIEFLTLCGQYAASIYPEIDSQTTTTRLQNSIDNLHTYLKHYENGPKQANKEHLSFIEAEQSLQLGHSVHPIPKSKVGWNEDELIAYSPETGGRFQLHYFLADPSLVVEQSALEEDITTTIKKELENSANLAPDFLQAFQSKPNWKVIPVHPFEARLLTNNKQVQALQEKGLLQYLGAAGAQYTATSSVRTVYNEDSPFMYKFSLHVKITNSERVNLLRELHRGYDISRLMKTAWGKGIQKDFPEVAFITDPAFITIQHEGEIIEGFNTSVRFNPFTKEGLNRNVSLLAALCQDGILGAPARLTVLIEKAAALMHKSVEETAECWFTQYLSVSLVPLIQLYNQYGLACEAHQQNVLLELDAQGFPAKLYFRDNQGFFFRLGKADELLGYIPDLADESMSLVPEEIIHPKYNYYLLINNVLGILNALTVQQLAKEENLINILYQELEQLEPKDETGFVSYILHSREWTAKANLLTNLHNMDEARQPMENPAVYVEIPNPLNKFHFSHALIKPSETGEVYSRYFEKEDITISLRPFQIDQDLEMVHAWFNEEHAKPIWKMDGPIQQLELFYRTLLPNDASHSFIGSINGEPTFTIEPYWPMRDLVGKYYDATPGDYGVHLLIAPTDKNKKFTFQLSQTVMDFVFEQPEVVKCIGEAAVESRAMHILVTRIGFRFQQVLEMPHKNANLTFCEREWFAEKFPESNTAKALTLTSI